MEKKMNGLSLDLLSVPGETILDYLIQEKMTQKELALRLDISKKHLNRIIKGLEPITLNTASKLENVFKISSYFWNNLEKKYQEEKFKLSQLNEISEEELSFLDENKTILNFLVKSNYINEAKSKPEKLMNLKKFLGINDFNKLDEILKVNGAFRKQNKFSYKPLAVAVWLKICEIETDNIKTEALNINKIKENLDIIKENMNEEPEIFIPQLKHFFSQNGVAFNVIKSVPNAPINGFIKKDKNKVILCLTIRGAYSDIFWFSLYHELGHLFSDKINSLFVDFNEKNSDNVGEKEADLFARNNILDEKLYNCVLLNPETINEHKIIEWANRMNIPAGIIVGRLQHDEVIPYNYYNNLRIKYKWAN